MASNEDDPEEEEGGGYNGEEEVVVLELDSIWDDDRITQYSDAEGKRRWKCGWCKKDFGGWNATKALAHLTKQTKQDIRPCKGRIDDEHTQMYTSLSDKSNRKRDRSRESSERIDRSITAFNTTTAAALEEHRGSSSGKKRTPNSSRILSHTFPVTEVHSPLVRNTATGATGSQEKEKAYVQLKIHDGPNPSSESRLTMAIGDMIHSLGLPFSVASNPKFRKVINLARAVGNAYKPPGRNQVATELLDLNYEAYLQKNMRLLKKEIEDFGITTYGDGATVKKMPLINVIASGAYLHVGVLEIVNCSSHMERGGKKDARYIASLFRPHIDKFEAEFPNCVDYVTFDGASNVQKAGEVLCGSYPRIVVTHGAEHVISLYFQDIFGLPILSTFNKLQKRAYAVLGSGAMHAPYAIFMKYSKVHNDGKNIGLYRAAGN
jgi:hypothetical protein